MEKQTKTKTACLVGGGDDPFLLLPEDSLIQILVRIPAIRSLLRLKSVCKSWRDLIRSPYFSHLHTTSNSSSYSSKLLGGSTFIFQGFPCTDLRWYYIKGGGGAWHWDNTNCGRYWVSNGRDWVWDDTNHRWYWVGDDQEELFKADDDDNHQQLVLKLDSLELPSCYKLSFGKLVKGSCNGLVCLYDPKLKDVSIWNPATRQIRRLPKSITTSKRVDSNLVRWDYDIVLFGFDVKTKDYKVLLITYSIQREYSWRVQVYSLSTDSWRLLEEEGINSPLALHGHGLYLNGSCFFMANGRFIYSFDFTKEIFTTIQIPDDHHRKQLYLYCLGGEKIALFTTLRKTPSGYLFQDEHDGYDDCDIWVLNEQGCRGGVNKESWIKLHSFQIKNTRLVIPRGISNNGKFALLETIDSSYASRMQLYNLVTKEVKMDFLCCKMGVRVSTADVYKPSLVSIIGVNGAGASSVEMVKQHHRWEWCSSIPMRLFLRM